MFIGLVSYFMLLIGSAQMESYYIIEFDKSIKKHVTSITKRQDADAVISVYASTYKEFDKEHKKRLKELQQKNIDYNTPRQWYLDFFTEAFEDRQKLQASFLSVRLRLQEIITQDEWEKILETTRANFTKFAEKKKKKREKNAGKDPYMKITNTIKETIPPGEKQTGSLEALDSFREKYKMIEESFENLHETEVEALGDRQATKEDLQEIFNSLNNLRKSMIESYIEVLFHLKDNTSEKEWSIIVKDINNL